LSKHGGANLLIVVFRFSTCGNMVARWRVDARQQENPRVVTYVVETMRWLSRVAEAGASRLAVTLRFLAVERPPAEDVPASHKASGNAGGASGNGRSDGKNMKVMLSCHMR
jgi:hypothetical protein